MPVLFVASKWKLPETWRHRDIEIETWKHGYIDMETSRHGEMETLKHGDVETLRHRHGDMDMKTWMETSNGKQKMEAQAIFLNPFTV